MKKYSELYKKIKQGIIEGEYKAGEKLPSKRTMADKQGVSVITVETAYAMLADEGYIYAKERSGYFVCRVEAEHTDAVRAQELHLSMLLPEETEEGEGEFEYSVYLKSLRKVISDKGAKLFVRSPSKGCAVLRNAISEYLFRYRGMYAPPSRIIIGSGSEQLYETAVKLLGRDRIYAIEDPSYSQISAVYEGMGVKLCRLPMGSDGIVSEAAQREFHILHVTPFHSYPSGVTATVSKRYEYLSWVKKRGGYLIEDDFDSEFFQRGQPIESLYSLDRSNSVIYINTFSKSLTPAMRLGYMILPEALLEEYDRRLSRFSCTVPVLEQYALADFISCGGFERHLNRMRRKMKLAES